MADQQKHNAPPGSACLREERFCFLGGATAGERLSANAEAGRKRPGRAEEPEQGGHAGRENREAVVEPGLGSDRRRAAEIEPIATVTALTPTALATRPEVTVRGTVIHVDPILRELLVEDDSGGVVVDLGAGGTESAEAIAVGDEVEITGRVGPGEYAPIVSAFRLESHGKRSLPPPRRCDPEAFLAGSEHGRLIEVEGIVQQAWHDGDRVLLEVETAGRLFTAEIPAAVVAAGVPGPDLQGLVDAVVVVAGPAKTVSNTRGETLRPWVSVDRAEWFTVVSGGVTFNKSAVPLESIGGCRPSFGGGHRIQTFGTIDPPGQRRLRRR